MQYTYSYDRTIVGKLTFSVPLMKQHLVITDDMYTANEQLITFYWESAVDWFESRLPFDFRKCSYITNYTFTGEYMELPRGKYALNSGAASITHCGKTTVLPTEDFIVKEGKNLLVKHCHNIFYISKGSGATVTFTYDTKGFFPKDIELALYHLTAFLFAQRGDCEACMQQSSIVRSVLNGYGDNMDVVGA